MEKTISPEFRVSFPNVFKAKAYDDGEEKYSITMLFPNDTDFAAMKLLAAKAAEAQWPDPVKRKQVMSNPNFKNPFRDGDTEKPNIEGYQGVTFVAASSKKAPGIVDQKNNLAKIVNEDEFYPGCYAMASLTAYGYEKKGNRGVAFGLQNVMKTRDGEPFSGRSKAEDDFSDFAVAKIDDPANDFMQSVPSDAMPSDDMFG